MTNITREQAIQIAKNYRNVKNISKTEVLSINTMLDEEYEVWIVAFELDTDIDPGTIMVEVNIKTGEASFFHHF